VRSLLKPSSRGMQNLKASQRLRYWQKPTATHWCYPCTHSFLSTIGKRTKDIQPENTAMPFVLLASLLFTEKPFDCCLRRLEWAAFFLKTSSISVGDFLTFCSGQERNSSRFVSTRSLQIWRMRLWVSESFCEYVKNSSWVKRPRTMPLISCRSWTSLSKLDSKSAASFSLESACKFWFLFFKCFLTSAKSSGCWNLMIGLRVLFWKVSCALLAAEFFAVLISGRSFCRESVLDVFMFLGDGLFAVQFRK